MRGQVKGEVVLVVAGAPAAPRVTTETPETLFARLTRDGHTRREAVKEIARLTGLPAREVFKRLSAEG